MSVLLECFAKVCHIVDHSKKEVIAAGNSLIDHLSSREKMTTITGT